MSDSSKDPAANTPAWLLPRPKAASHTVRLGIDTTSYNTVLLRVSWEVLYRSCMQGSHISKHQHQPVQDPSNSGSEAQPPTKKRKHDGVRFGPPSEATATPVPSHRQQHKSAPQAVNHVTNERKLAEAQLHGRTFQLDTSSCTQAEQEVFFSSAGWSLPEMMIAKQQLNDTKGLLDSKDIK